MANFKRSRYKFNIKKLSETRWEAKISSVKAVRYQISDFHDALVSLAESATDHGDHDVAHESATLAEQLKDLSFIVSLVIWYEVLFQMNIVSKTLQKKDMDFAECTEMVKNCLKFMEDYRLTGFKQAIITAKELPGELQTAPEFKPPNRIKRVKKKAGEKARDEPVSSLSPEKQLEIDFFNPLVDTIIVSLKERFTQLKEYSESFGFLYKLDDLPVQDTLLKHCKNLQTKLTVDGESDICGVELFNELNNMKSLFSNQLKDKTPLGVLNFIKKHSLQDLCSNIWLIFRILLTIPVTVASGERSFSKLKLIKTFLRSVMEQGRLFSLGTISIKNKIADELDFSDLIKDFAELKARKVNFF